MVEVFRFEIWAENDEGICREIYKKRPVYDAQRRIDILDNECRYPAYAWIRQAQSTLARDNSIYAIKMPEEYRKVRSIQVINYGPADRKGATYHVTAMGTDGKIDDTGSYDNYEEARKATEELVLDDGVVCYISACFSSGNKIIVTEMRPKLSNKVQALEGEREIIFRKYLILGRETCQDVRVI